MHCQTTLCYVCYKSLEQSGQWSNHAVVFQPEDREFAHEICHLAAARLLKGSVEFSDACFGVVDTSCEILSNTRVDCKKVADGYRMELPSYGGGYLSAANVSALIRALYPFMMDE